VIGSPANSSSILENVNHGFAGETGVLIRRSQSKTATNQNAARSAKLTRQRFKLRKSSGHYRVSSD
jgi:hypothetical protein